MWFFCQIVSRSATSCFPICSLCQLVQQDVTTKSFRTPPTPSHTDRFLRWGCKWAPTKVGSDLRICTVWPIQVQILTDSPILPPQLLQCRHLALLVIKRNKTGPHKVVRQPPRY